MLSHQPADKVVEAFKGVVQGKVMRQGLSSILNQTLPNAVSMLSNRVGLASTSRTPKGHPTNIPGVEKFVSRDSASGKYKVFKAADIANMADGTMLDGSYNVDATAEVTKGASDPKMFYRLVIDVKGY